jgi:hypothetical protein
MAAQDGHRGADGARLGAIAQLVVISWRRLANPTKIY